MITLKSKIEVTIDISNRFSMKVRVLIVLLRL
jgi:hypothetical protein